MNFNFNFNSFIYCHHKSKDSKNECMSSRIDASAFNDLKNKYEYFLNAPHFEDSEFYSHEI